MDARTRSSDDDVIELEIITKNEIAVDGNDKETENNLVGTDINKPIEKEYLVIKDINSDRHIIITLIKDFSKIVITRIVSVTCFSASLQMFIRQSKTNSLISADISNIGNVSLVIRELLRFITNDTKLAVENNQPEKLQELFVTAHLAALPAAALAWAITQPYALILPWLGRDPIVAEQLKFMPTKFLENTVMAFALSFQANYGYGRNQLIPVMISYSVGGAMMAANYAWIRKVNPSINGFLFASMTQNIAIAGCYLGYIQRYHANERLIQSLFNFRKWPALFKESLRLMKSGLQPASILGIEVFSNILITFTMRDKTELAAYQGLQIIPFIFSSMSVTLESRIAVQIIEITKRYQANPDKLAKELKQLLLHAAWIGNVLPITFFITGLALKHSLVSLLIKSSDENADIIQSAERDIILVLSLPILRTLRSVSYGFITGYKQSHDPFHQKQNQHATLVNTGAAITTLLIGIGLDYGFAMGAYGFWLGAAISLGTSFLGQSALASRSIQHEVEVRTPRASFSEENLPKTSNTWFGFWSHSSTSNQQQLLQKEQNTSPGLLERSSSAFKRLVWR